MLPSKASFSCFSSGNINASLISIIGASLREDGSSLDLLRLTVQVENAGLEHTKNIRNVKINLTIKSIKQT